MEVEDLVRVPPHLTKREIPDAIREVLLNRYKNQYYEKFGYVVDVVEVKPSSENRVILGDPNIYYKVKYKLLVFIPEPNEVFLGIVRDVVEYGAYVLIGPFEGLLHISQIAKEKFYFNREERKLENKDKSKSLAPGDKVYVKISTVSIKGSVADAKISLTMRNEGLGAVSWYEEKKK